MTNKKTKGILLVPFKTIDKEIINHLEKKITQILGYKVAVNKEQMEIPDCRKRGVQLFAKDLLSALRKELMKTNADAVLGITDRDLYAENFNFIFGLAYSDCSVISLYRLVSEDKGLFYIRAVKEAVHELGHVAGLDHCPNIGCVMHFSNSLEDTDIKHEVFCNRCEERLKRISSKT
jgi:archaemetzincin